jgi:hypothetical protein
MGDRSLVVASIIPELGNGHFAAAKAFDDVLRDTNPQCSNSFLGIDYASPEFLVECRWSGRIINHPLNDLWAQTRSH